RITSCHLILASLQCLQTAGRILQHFNDHPELKKNQRYEGLFNLTRSRRRRLENDNVAPEFPQDIIPPNSIHQPSRYSPQPAWIRVYLHPAMHLHIIQCTILYLGLHLFFTLTSHWLVDLSLVCLRIFELVVERRCMTLGALVMLNAG
ncbi:hypothetical protein F4604DRAFT_1715869, partial [Suillus subluteus]